MTTDPTPEGVVGAHADATNHLVPRTVRPIDIEHDELMARAAAELQQHLTDHTPSCNARTDHLMRRAAWALGMPRPAHVGGNAEDCPGCEGANPPYPFICPGPAAEQPRTTPDNPAATDLHTRVTALYEQWVKAGPPPLGVSTARWWDRRLVELHAALNPAEPAPVATEATEPATILDPAYLRQAYAEAIAADDGHPWNTLCADTQQHYRDNADAVLAVRDRHVLQLRQRLALADEWTPPPPGSTAEQLPDHLLALIRDRLPDYTSTACQTADTLACTACYPGSGIPRPQYDEIREHAERLHERCQDGNEFTGQLCACGCHPTTEEQPRCGDSAA